MNPITKTLLTAAVVAVVFFYAGVKYNQSHAATLPTRNSTGQFLTAGGRFGGRGGMAGGFISGTILSKDAQSITVSTQGGGSKIVFIGSSTPVTKTVAGSDSDLAAGQGVVVTGMPNSDGSITARAVELRQLPLTNNQ